MAAALNLVAMRCPLVLSVSQVSMTPSSQNVWRLHTCINRIDVIAGRSLLVNCAQKEKGKAAETKQFVKGNVAQILGIRGGDQETNIWKIRLQLTKPVTWIPLIWGMTQGEA